MEESEHPQHEAPAVPEAPADPLRATATPTSDRPVLNREPAPLRGNGGVGNSGQFSPGGSRFTPSTLAAIQNGTVAGLRGGRTEGVGGLSGGLGGRMLRVFGFLHACHR